MNLEMAEAYEECARLRAALAEKDAEIKSLTVQAIAAGDKAYRDGIVRCGTAPAPVVGTIIKCLVCALDKPWATWSPHGVAVCVDCRAARFALGAAQGQVAALRGRVAALRKVEDAARELLEVADLRDDTTLPHPADDPKLWTARMQSAWDDIRARLDHTYVRSDNNAAVCGNCGGFYYAHPPPERLCRGHKASFIRAGKCGGCELDAVVDGSCVACGARADDDGMPEGEP